MTTVLDRLSSGARIAIIRLRSLGDCVLTTPALHLLKRARPDLQISVIVEDAFAPVFESNPDVAHILPPSLVSINRWCPELALNFHGGTRSALLTAASLAPIRAAFNHFRFGPLYNVRIPRAQEILGVNRTVHTAEHLASAMFHLGVPRQEIPRARLFAAPARATRPYAVLHPVASAPEKTWPAEKFQAVAEHLRREARVEPVFIAGPGESLASFHEYRCIAGAPLRQIKSLVAGASLFIGNDSGPAHMAAAFGIPVIVLFGPSDPQIWAPWKTESAVLHATDIAGISVDDVIGALAGLPA